MKIGLPAMAALLLTVCARGAQSKSTPEILLRVPGDISFSALAFSPDGKKLALCASPTLTTERSGGVKVYDLASGRVKSLSAGYAHNPDKQFDQAQALFFTPDGTLLGDCWSYVPVWNTSSRAPARVLTQAINNNSLCLSADGRVAAVAHASLLEAWSVASGKRLWTLRVAARRDAMENYGTTLEGLSFSPDGKLLAFVRRTSNTKINSPRAELFLLDVRSRKIRWMQPVDGFDTFALFFSPQSVMTYSAYGSVVRFHRLQDGKVLRKWKVSPEFGHDDLITDVIPGLYQAVSTRGRLLASGFGQNIVVQDLMTGQALRHFYAATWVTSITFAPDARSLVAGYGDNTIKRWSIAAGDS